MGDFSTEADGDADENAPTRTATVRTDHATATCATRVARAVAPDNTASMTTRVVDDCVETDVARETTGGLQATVDDYLVNLGVATAVLDACGNQHSRPTTTTHHDTLP